MSGLWTDHVLPTSWKQMTRRSLMKFVAETRIHVRDHSLSVDTRLRSVVTFLVGTLGIVLVALLAWVVLFIVR
jgi:hypothetical protein